MRFSKFLAGMWLLALMLALYPSTSHAWFDETHIAVAKVAGYQKWFNAAGADIAKLKLGHREGHNHFVNNPRGTVITPEKVLAQVEKYNQIDPSGHIYGAIIASVREYIEFKKKGRYAEYHLAYAVHYIADMSQPVEGGGKSRRWSAKNCDAELISDLLSAFLSTPNLYFSSYGSNWQWGQFLFPPGLAQTVALPVGLNDMTSVG